VESGDLQDDQPSLPFITCADAKRVTASCCPILWLKEMSLFLFLSSKFGKVIAVYFVWFVLCDTFLSIAAVVVYIDRIRYRSHRLD